MGRMPPGAQFGLYQGRLETKNVPTTENARETRKMKETENVC